MPKTFADLTREEWYKKAGFSGRIGFGQHPALLMVDYINAFTNPDLPTGANMDREVEATAQLVQIARRRGLPVIFSTLIYDKECREAGHWARKSATMKLQDWTAGSDLVRVDARLKPLPGETIIVKKFASVFFGTHLASFLTSMGVDTLIITGCSTSGCVRATTVDALQHGFRPIVPRQCVADRDPLPHEANLFDLDAKYADVLDISQVVSYLERLPSVDARG